MHHYQTNFGIYVSAKEQEALFVQLDDTGLELVMKKKLATRKQFLAA